MNVSNNCQVRQVSKSQLSKSFDDLLANASWSPILASFRDSLQCSDQDSLIKPDLTSSIDSFIFSGYRFTKLIRKKTITTKIWHKKQRKQTVCTRVKRNLLSNNLTRATDALACTEGGMHIKNKDIPSKPILNVPRTCCFSLASTLLHHTFFPM